MQRKVGAVFEAFVFEPEPSRWQASETDGLADRPTERERRSQHVEVEFIVFAQGATTRRIKKNAQTPSVSPKPRAEKAQPNIDW